MNIFLSIYCRRSIPNCKSSAILPVVDEPTPRKYRNFVEGFGSETPLLDIPLYKLGSLGGLQNSLTFVPDYMKKK
jgi:hypothetical protein